MDAPTRDEKEIKELAGLMELEGVKEEIERVKDREMIGPSGKSSIE